MALCSVYVVFSFENGEVCFSKTFILSWERTGARVALSLPRFRGLISNRVRIFGVMVNTLCEARSQGALLASHLCVTWGICMISVFGLILRS